MVIRRIIGSYSGEEKGPLFITFGGMHGNETAGVKALDLILKMLEVEPITNPNFNFKGNFIAISGNLNALAKNVRYIDKDLNRQFTPSNIQRIKNSPIEQLDNEDKELKAIVTIIESAIEEYNPDKIVILDLHTTSSDGGIFSITTDDEDSIELGMQLHAPVVLGIIRGMGGTTLHYFNSQNLNKKVIALSFEAGQHDDPVSINRSIAAVITCMRSIGCVTPQDVNHHHDHLLQEYGKNLPAVVELSKIHHIQPEDQFQMRPGFLNFQSITEGELLAMDKRGPIYAKEDGLMLMPLYQAQGTDGFFIVKKIKPKLSD